MKNPAKPTSSCTEHSTKTSPTSYFYLLHPWLTNLSNMSSQIITAGDCLNIPSEKRPLVSVVRQRICKIILRFVSSRYPAYFNNRTAILHNKIILSMQDVSPNLIFEKFSTNSWPAKVFLLFLAPITPIFFILNVSIVVQFYITKTL